jgi:formate dehydrogenase subunit beta
LTYEKGGGGMKTQWMLETRGDPIGAVREFVKSVWLNAELDGVVVPQINAHDSGISVRTLGDPEDLDEINPFKPLMKMNAARIFPRLLEANPDLHLGALLRPCEMRALIEMAKHGSFALDRLLTICVDCLGTYPAEDYQWRAERKGSSRKLAQEALQFARLGSISAYRFRSACQMCTSPEAKGAHLNLSVLGLPVRRHILVEARDPITADWLHLDALTHYEADQGLINQHERALTRVVERNNRTRNRIIQGLSELLPRNVEALVEQFETCDGCQECMDSCPICAVIYPRQDAEGRYLHEDIRRWMLSCAGCGMCEQVCPNHLPLSAVFHNLRQQLIDSLGYTPGYSREEPVPLM